MLFAEGTDGACLSHSDGDSDGLCDVCGTVYYYEWNTITEKPQEKAIAAGAFETIGDPDESTELAGLALTAGWYYLTGDVEVTNRITVDGSVPLILGNGKTLTADLGIGIAGESSNLTIYAQSLDKDTMGKLTVPGTDVDYAGIGGDKNVDCGNITICGGRFNVTVGVGAAGIGSGYSAECRHITINGGVFENVSGGRGAPIGSGWYGKSTGKNKKDQRSLTKSSIIKENSPAIAGEFSLK